MEFGVLVCLLSGLLFYQVCGEVGVDFVFLVLFGVILYVLQFVEDVFMVYVCVFVQVCCVEGEVYCFVFKIEFGDVFVIYVVVLFV